MIIRTITALRKMLETARRYGKKVGLVPTMGALHEGHLSLVDRSARDCDFTVVSIFVNPLQFGANEDLDKYPRRLREDAALCAERGADFVFAPNSKEMYGDSPQTFVYNPELENIYCGLYRPGHFQGVLTVVAKLFLAVQPTHAYFGKKDYQQAYMIRRMVLDLNFPLQVVSLPTKREKSGLARSSRNEYMSAEERSAAASIYAGLRAAKDAYGSGERRVPALRKMVGSFIGKSGGNVQYIEIASRKALAPQSGVLKVPAVILVACYFGKTRLIDNLEL